MIYLKNSVWEFAYLMGVHAFAVVCVGLFYEVNSVVKGLLLLLVGMNFCWCVYKKNRWGIVAIGFVKNKTWKIRVGSGEIIQVKLSGRSILLPQFAIMHFEAVLDKKKFCVVLFPDRLSRADFISVKRGMKFGYV